MGTTVKELEDIFFGGGFTVLADPVGLVVENTVGLMS
jgi:hypothetical protein